VIKLNPTVEIPNVLFPGESLSITIDFTNEGDQVGYLPFVDIVIPSSNGSGILFNDVYFGGAPVSTKYVLPFGTQNQVTHPLASGNPKVFSVYGNTVCFLFNNLNL